MGLFGLKKKSQPQNLGGDFNAQGFGGQGTPEYNSGLGTQNYDPLMDSNSGLKLSELNSNQDMNGQPGLDSFGNPRPQARNENFEYRQTAPVAVQDNSKDLQLIIAKLDAIRSEITNINHRLDNIERTQKETPPRKYPW